MKFGGFLKHSLIDYPGKVSCVVFLSGCNFRCPYCHNPELVSGNPSPPEYLTLSWLRDFLRTRRGLIDGVVITGGEPTLQADLEMLCRFFKDQQLAVKLDTNGSRPDAVRRLLTGGWVDFVAMDIKADPDDYPEAIVADYHPEAIKETIRVIMAHARDYEFRTTCAPGLVNGQTIAAISRRIAGARRYCLQRFNPKRVLRPDFFDAIADAGPGVPLEDLRQIAEREIDVVAIR